MTAARPLVSRHLQRTAYGDRMLDAAAAVVDALHHPHEHPAGAWQAAVDQALAIPQPRGEDPVHWLCAALAAQVDPRVPFEQRTVWLRAGQRHGEEIA